ncbi:MAG: hypothetical protein N2253_02565 [Bacteroidia bacterium]|nr:hypothetical protein [Bacteroidia bacterium]
MRQRLRRWRTPWRRRQPPQAAAATSTPPLQKTLPYHISSTISRLSYTTLYLRIERRHPRTKITQ